MFFQYDNIIAGMIAITVVLIILAFQHQGQQAAADATRYLSAKKNALNLAEMVKYDFQNMKADQMSGPNITDKTDSTIRFTAQINSAGDIAEVYYLRAHVSETPGGDPLYEIRRYIDGEYTGSSLPQMSEFSIRMMGMDGTEITSLSDLSNVFTVEVRSSSLSMHGEGDFVRGSSWSSVFRPRRLASLN